MKNLSVVLLFASAALLVTVQCRYVNNDFANEQEVREALLMQLQDAAEDQGFLDERQIDYNQADKEDNMEDLEERQYPDDGLEAEEQQQRNFDAYYRQVERSYDPDQKPFDTPYDK